MNVEFEARLLMVLRALRFLCIAKTFREDLVEKASNEAKEETLEPKQKARNVREIQRCEEKYGFVWLNKMGNIIYARMQSH